MIIKVFNITFHIFEIPLLIFLVFAAFHSIQTKGLKFKVIDSGPLLFYLIGSICFLSTIAVSMLMAFNQSLVVKALIKWFEVFLLTFLIFFWIDSIRKFKFIYIVLLVGALGFPLLVYLKLLLGSIAFNQYRIFSGYEPLFAFTLLFPFMENFRKDVLFILFLCLVAVFLSFSRGAWLALFPSLLILFKKWYAKKKMLLLAALSLFFVFIISYKPVQILLSWRLISAVDPQSASNIERFGMAKVALDAFKSSPIFGIGAENYASFLVKTGQWDIIRTKEFSTLTPHNFFLQLLAECGVVGFCSFLLVLISLVYILLKVKSPLISNYIKGLQLVFFTFVITITIGYIAGHFRFFMALIFGLILTLMKPFEVKSEC